MSSKIPPLVNLFGFAKNEKEQKVMANFSRMKIIGQLGISKEPLSLMELSRRIDKKKTTTDFHIRKLQEVGFVKITKSKKQQHNPLIITLRKDIHKDFQERGCQVNGR